MLALSRMLDQVSGRHHGVAAALCTWQLLRTRPSAGPVAPERLGSRRSPGCRGSHYNPDRDAGGSLD